MKFFDRKEDVLDVELTQYGKYLLSIGQLKPEYYAFFDDDILYDSRYASVIGETQNDIHDRIKETPRPLVQYIYHGLETEITKNNRFIRSGQVDEFGVFSRLYSKKVQPVADKHYAVSAPLGTISLESDKAPAWSFNVLEGEISGSIHYQSGDQPTLRVPQITMDPIEYKTVSQQDTSLETLGATTLQEGNEAESVAPSDLSFLIKKFKDGSFINVFEDTIVIELEELNAALDNENFDIEVFQVEEESVDNNTNEILIPLGFAHKKKIYVRNNILLDDDEIRKQNELQAEVDTTCVEYFFDILIDDEVDSKIKCKLSENKTENFLNRDSIKCNEVEVVQKKLYTSNVQEPDLKDC